MIVLPVLMSLSLLSGVAGMLVDPEQPKVKIGDEMRNNAVGSMLIIEANTLEEARQLIANDVYWQKGVVSALRLEHVIS